MTRAVHRRFAAFVVLYVALLVALGPSLHPIGIRSALDQYAERARQLLDGVWVGDPFHPFLYPQLTALATLVVGDAFAAARVVSSLAAGLLLYASGRFAHAVHGAGFGWVAALLAANGAIVVLGVEAGADMTAAALAVTGLWRLAAPPPAARAFAAGVWLGLAVATRLNLAVLLPGFAVVVAATGGAPWLQRARRCAVLAAGAVIGYLPNLVPSVILFGTPLPGDSWRNLAWKLSPNADPSAVARPPYTGLAELLHVDGERLVLRSADDFRELWLHGLGRCLAGGSAPAPVTLLFTLLLASAFVVLALRRPRVACWSLALLLALTGSIAATFFPQNRLLLPIAPVAAASVVAAVFVVARRRPALAHAACAVLVATVATSIVPAVRTFRDEHPLPEVEAARALAARDGPMTSIASFYPLLASNVRARAVYVWTPPILGTTPATVVARVLDAVRDGTVDYVVLGPRSVRVPSVDALVRELPPTLQVERAAADVLVLRVERPDVPWLATASASAGDDGVLRLRITTTCDVVAAGFTVQAPGAAPWLLPLARSGERTFAGELPLRAVPTRDVALVPGCLLANGAALRAPPITIAPR